MSMDSSERFGAVDDVQSFSDVEDVDVSPETSPDARRPNDEEYEKDHIIRPTAKNNEHDEAMKTIYNLQAEVEYLKKLNTTLLVVIAAFSVKALIQCSGCLLIR